MRTDPVLVRSANGVGRLTFNRPERRNALSPQMLELFHDKLEELDADREIRCILAADFVIADQTAALVFGHIRMGLVPDMGLTYYLPRVVGERRALQLTLLGSQLDAAQAKELGLVDEAAASCVSDEDFMEAVTAFCERRQAKFGPRS
jgi:enoyl-CoA hydratase/carnithine racemase